MYGTKIGYESEFDLCYEHWKKAIAPSNLNLVCAIAGVPVTCATPLFLMQSPFE